LLLNSGFCQQIEENAAFEELRRWEENIIPGVG
jgi:hypothetical protein